MTLLAPTKESLREPKQRRHTAMGRPSGSKHFVERRKLRVPWDMFSVNDIAEYMGINRKVVRKCAIAMGLVAKLPGRNVYGPMDRDAAKRLIHYLHCRKM